MKIFIALFILVFLTSCSDAVYDERGNLLCSNKTDCGSKVPEVLGIPFDDINFTDTLQNVRLHYPNIETDVDYGNFDNFVTSYFYVHDSLLTFQLDKTNIGKLRSELRFGPSEWDVADNREYILKANIRAYGSKKLSKYTFIQIHGNQDFSLPLLRITWERRRAGKTNHIWAILMTSKDWDIKTYEWFDLGTRKDKFFDIKVSIQNSRILITKDDKIYVDRDISYWNGIQNYYKAGLYLSDIKSKGMTKVEFKSVEYLVKP